MAARKIAISRLTRQEIDELFVFRGTHFPKNSKRLDLERWKWLYMHNPVIEDSEIPTWVLKDCDKIVGTISCIPVRVKLDNKEFICAFGSDYFVDKRYLGLPALRLLKTMQRSYPINIGANLSPSATKLFAKMGYYDLSAHLVSATTYFPTNIKKPPVDSLLKFYINNTIRSLRCLKRYTVRISRSIPQTVDELWEQVSKGLTVSVVKDYNYLKWRYADCPSVNYRFFLIEYAQKLEAVAVIAVLQDDKGEKRGILSDFLLKRDNLSVAYGLINAALDFFIQEKCVSCFTVMLDEKMSEVFRRMNFNMAKSDLGLMVLAPKPQNESFENLTHPGKWSFFIGDTDRF